MRSDLPEITDLVKLVTLATIDHIRETIVSAIQRLVSGPGGRGAEEAALS